MTFLFSVRASSEFRQINNLVATNKKFSTIPVNLFSTHEDSNAARAAALVEAKKPTKTQVVKNVLDMGSSSEGLVPVVEESVSGTKSFKLVPENSAAAKAVPKSSHLLVCNVYYGGSLAIRQ